MKKILYCFRFLQVVEIKLQAIFLKTRYILDDPYLVLSPVSSNLWRSNCTKCLCGRGCVLDPARAAYDAPQCRLGREILLPIPTPRRLWRLIVSAFGALTSILLSWHLILWIRHCLSFPSDPINSAVEFGGALWAFSAGSGGRASVEIGWHQCR